MGSHKCPKTSDIVLASASIVTQTKQEKIKTYKDEMQCLNPLSLSTLSLAHVLDSVLNGGWK